MSVQEWDMYEAGKKYNDRLNVYNTSNTNWDFFSDEQWPNLELDDEVPTPVFNLIKRVITFFISSLTTSRTKISFEPLLYSDVEKNSQMVEEQKASEIGGAAVKNLLEKLKFEYKQRESLFDAAITGDGCAHFYFDMSQKPYGGPEYGDIQGDIAMELIDNTNVMFGNANNPNVDIQPYIIIIGRDLAKNLQEEAARYNQASDIQEDKDYNEFTADAGKIEVETDGYGKATYIIVYRKEGETIKATKCVKDAYIYKDIDTGLRYYPVAFYNWEKQKNQYHGRALCTAIIPNQIFINRMFAMVMYHLMMAAFPKAVYDSSKIEQWTNQIGEAIAVNGLQVGEKINDIAGYLEPGRMSDQIIQVIDLAFKYTKDALGATDAALGDVKPDNTSAIIAVQKSSAIPLENPKANMYAWIEDIGKIILDMMGTYYGLRPIVIEKDVPVIDEVGNQALDPLTGQPKTTKQKEIINFDFSVLKDMWLKCKVDVGESSYWSEIASNQTLDNLLHGGYIDIIDYLERISDEYIPQKQDLINAIKSRMEQKQQQELMTMQLQQKTPQM
jgi:hypothetical protein